MIPRILPLAGVAAFALTLAGCAGVPAESTDSGASAADSKATAETTAPRSEGSGSRSAAESKRAESSTASSTATSAKTDPDGPRSSWRAERDSQREAREARAAASGGSADNARLLEQLNDASRELATLRAANAKLRAERGAAPAAASSTATSVAKNDVTDDKLAMSLKSYAQFKQEMASVFADLERLRRENVGLSSNLKSAVEQADQARSAMARLETDLRTERKSRAEAEQAAAQLREQLRSIARALSAAGLSVDKLAANAESSGAKSR